jgi:ankyrin repeat protein
MNFLRRRQTQYTNNEPELACAFAKACETGDLKMVKYLHTKKGAVVNDQLAVNLAGKNGHLDVIKWLHDNGANLADDWSNTTIHCASENGYADVVRYFLITAGNIKEIWINISIQSAAKKGHLDVVKCLHVDGGADITIWDNKLVREAFKKNQKHVVEYLLANNAVLTEKMKKDCYAEIICEMNQDQEYEKMMPNYL